MSREEKIKCLIESIHEIEDAIVSTPYFDSCTDKQIDKEVK
ncbi:MULTISPECIES: hypothetical protein [Bacillus]|nr:MULTISPECIES: hypothetical protein [Bacillus cereus group]MED2997242.1 hypothetical protein [Bacillus tropicus]